ncbi:hypothetical protein CQ12_04110 [Bradyrhizobium jicamae]|uniref:Uncharacterized protein n=1 Tax=Bradyrhizobium jicamae TaxID=280332 RepID=A0A0R3KP75_9BRAD|nr:hypothetical protein [Bradyrhizobium jicamae]KRQ94722.1 hypothetical protein CQ12_04110 [Bradyrhizobium jicamae]
MAINSANNASPSRFDPSARAFRLLGIDPGATASEIRSALGRAREMHIAPEKDLAEASAIVLDPVRRLASELSYPLDSTPDRVDLFYTERPADASDDDILQTSTQFAPLSAANFIARHAVRRGASSELLLGLIDAHNSIDVMEIYRTLQALRNRAGWPPPSLASVRDGLDDLLDAHCVAAIAAYDPIEAAAEPMLEATRWILATREPPLIQTHSLLLEAYRRAIAKVRAKADQQVDSACQALEQHSGDASSVERLADALHLWASLCEPLLLLDAHQELNDGDAKVTPDRVFGLLGELSSQRHYRTAQQVLEHALIVFGSIPDAAARLAEVGDILREMLQAGSTAIVQNPELAVPVRSSGFPHVRTAAVAAAALLVMLGLLVAYWAFDGEAALSVASAPNPPEARAEPELLPPVGKGQRFAREYVRYCRFQEERLRVVKQQVRGPEDIRAYNALASDYNSRCSDFFYQDEDLRAVKEEVTAKQKILEADAERILSTWPWRTNVGRAPTASPR